MYDRVAEFHSEMMAVGFAPYPNGRSLTNGSAPLGSTPAASLGSTSVTSTRSVLKSGVGTSGLLRFSESLCTRSSDWGASFRQLALGTDCPHDILGQDAPIASPSTPASLSSLHAEFFAANSDQDTR